MLYIFYFNPLKSHLRIALINCNESLCVHLSKNVKNQLKDVPSNTFQPSEQSIIENCDNYDLHFCVPMYIHYYTPLLLHSILKVIYAYTSYTFIMCVWTWFDCVNTPTVRLYQWEFALKCTQRLGSRSPFCHFFFVSGIKKYGQPLRPWHPSLASCSYPFSSPSSPQFGEQRAGSPLYCPPTRVSIHFHSFGFNMIICPLLIHLWIMVPWQCLTRVSTNFHNGCFTLWQWCLRK